MPQIPIPGRAVRGSSTGRPIMALLDLLGRRWTLRVIWELRDGRGATFRDLQIRCGGVSSSVLTERIRELTQSALIERQEAGYTLTTQGLGLLHTLEPLDDWATRWQPAATPAAPSQSEGHPSD